jgi:hypothetical protein
MFGTKIGLWEDFFVAAVGTQAADTSHDPLFLGTRARWYLIGPHRPASTYFAAAGVRQTAQTPPRLDRK